MKYLTSSGYYNEIFNIKKDEIFNIKKAIRLRKQNPTSRKFT